MKFKIVLIAIVLASITLLMIISDSVKEKEREEYLAGKLEGIKIGRSLMGGGD